MARWTLAVAGVVWLLVGTAGVALALTGTERVLSLLPPLAIDADALGGAVTTIAIALIAIGGAHLAIVDPVTAASYAYAITGARSYELCATFTTDTAQSDDVNAWPGEAWGHDAGPHCFQRKVKVPGKDE